MKQRGFASKYDACKAWARKRGFKGHQGGWIHAPTSDPNVSKPICQGWITFYHERGERYIYQGQDGKWFYRDE